MKDRSYRGFLKRPLPWSSPCRQGTDASCSISANEGVAKRCRSEPGSFTFRSTTIGDVASRSLRTGFEATALSAPEFEERDDSSTA